MSGISKKTS